MTTEQRIKRNKMNERQRVMIDFIVMMKKFSWVDSVSMDYGKFSKAFYCDIKCTNGIDAFHVTLREEGFFWVDFSKDQLIGQFDGEAATYLNDLMAN